MKTVQEAAAESTCLKRVIVCELLDVSRRVLACESNRCSPPDGVCARIGMRNSQSDYPSHSTCNWTHAEVMAIKSLPPGAEPVVAVIYGHDFACPSCATSLRNAGVATIEIARGQPGVGVRST